VTLAVAKEVRHLFTAAEAARRLSIPPGTIRAWRSRGKLWEYGLDERGRPMYDRDHLIALRDGRVLHPSKRRKLT